MAKITYKTKTKALVIDCNQSEIPENVKFFYKLADISKVKQATITIDNDDDYCILNLQF